MINHQTTSNCIAHTHRQTDTNITAQVVPLRNDFHFSPFWFRFFLFFFLNVQKLFSNVCSFFHLLSKPFTNVFSFFFSLYGAKTSQEHITKKNNKKTLLKSTLLDLDAALGERRRWEEKGRKEEQKTDKRKIELECNRIGARERTKDLECMVD